MQTLAPAELDLALVRRAQLGDRVAFGELVRRHQHAVYGAAYRFLGDPDRAKDMAQDAFVQMFKALGQFRGESRFTTWAFVIVRNLCYARSRTLARELAVLDADDGASLVRETAPGPGEAYEERELQEGVMTALRALPQKYRLVLELHHFQGMKYEEVAEVLDLPMGTVKTHLHRAKAALRAALEQEGLV